MKTFFSFLLRYVCIPVLLGILNLWSFGALYYGSFPLHPAWRPAVAWGYAVVLVILLRVSRRYARAVMIALVSFFSVALWFNSVRPASNGVYPANLDMPGAEFHGDRVTIHNVRNCDYRTADDFDVHYETRTYALDDLKTLDVLVNYWGMDWIAHTFLSFGFSDGRYLAVSVEIRPEVGESYGELKGIFKQYELIYIWADERDLVRVRTNYRKEDVYLYRTSFAPDQIRKIFISMLERTEAIRQKPEFYNTITQSCTNTLGNHLIASGVMPLPFWKRRLLTGNIDRRLYNEGLVETFGKPFPELRAISRIDDRAKAADRDTRFSEKIRAHLPNAKVNAGSEDNPMGDLT